MELISDILLILAAATAGIYCFVLSRRLSRFSDLDKGVGGAIAVLSAQVDDMTRNLQAAQNSAGDSSKKLLEVTERAEDASRRLELMVASLHDIPQPQAATPSPPQPQPRPTAQAQPAAVAPATPTFSPKAVPEAPAPPPEPQVTEAPEPEEEKVEAPSDPVFTPRIRFGAAG